MATPWVTIAELKQAIADALTKDIDKLPSKWNRIGAQALADATNDIVKRLLDKGFTMAQINAWDERCTYCRDIALYHALVKGAAAMEYDQTTIDKLDRRKMIEEQASIMIGSQLVFPGAAEDTTDAAVGPGSGAIDDSGYRFNMNTHM